MTGDIKKPTTGPDIAKQSANEKAIIDALAKEMRLRQWCVEQVVKLLAVGSFDKKEFEELVQYTFDFITNKETDNGKAS